MTRLAQSLQSLRSHSRTTARRFLVHTRAPFLHLRTRQHRPNVTERVIVVGNGMAGFKFCEQLRVLAGNRRHELVVFGAEARPAYDRVHLTECVHGRNADSLFLAPPEWYAGRNIELHLGDPVLEIHRESRMVRTASGRALYYDRLVLATGSRPFVPPIEGATLDNVFVYRSVEHIDALRAAMSRSKRAAVIGGGLLGLEVAHALHHAGLETHIVEHGSGLLARQLPPSASALLQLQIESLGLHVHLNRHTSRIVADGTHRSIEFTDGPGLATDLVVITAGIRPRDELAAAAGLALGPRGGIVVDDFLQTSDPRIHAIGECAIHNGRHYGFAAPGFRMADVLASNLAGSRKRFTGADLSSKLKLPGITVANLGDFQADAGAITFQDATSYRQLILKRNRVVGAITVGDWPELNRVQEAIDSGRRLWRRQLARFEGRGTIWPERDFVDVAQWPAGALVCHCMKVKRGILSQAVARGCDSVEGLAQTTGASTVCGSCKPLLSALVGARASLKPAKGWKTLIGASAIALLLALVIAFAGPIPITESVQTGWRIEALWRDAFWKQTTGYTLLGLCLASLSLSLRKRIKRFALGNFAGWRAIHGCVGALTLAFVVTHTGLRLGHNLNLVLMIDFLALAALGAFAGSLTALEARLAGPAARRLRAFWTGAHIVLVWPLPVLVLFHVLTAYYF